MTNKEILKKAIETANNNGYKDYFPSDVDGETGLGTSYRWYKVVFSHDFAKKFWGKGIDSWKNREAWICPEHGTNECLFWDPDFDRMRCRECYVDGYEIGGDWRFHLQQMVLQKSPIKYLEQFLVKG